MNYKHIYHVGNFADVIKHILLIAVIKKMRDKPKGFVVLDAFSGSGIYNLNSKESVLSTESEAGIKLLLNNDIETEKQHLLQSYINVIKQYYYNTDNTYTLFDSNNDKTSNSLYPGSPAIASHFVRKQDKIICIEKNKNEFLLLKNNISYLKSVPTIITQHQLHNRDGYEAIAALFPFNNLRCFILIDPPFEVTNEFEKIIQIFKIIKYRSVTTPVMTWYPIKNRSIIKQFYEQYNNIRYPETLFVEFKLHIPHKSTGLQECGVMISSPPDIYSEIESTLKFLCNIIDAWSYKCWISSGK